MKRLLPKKKKRPPPQRVREHPHKEFEDALKEYHQTVRPTYSNDDGLHDQYVYEQQQHQHQHQHQDVESQQQRRQTISEPGAPRGAGAMSPIQEATSSGVASQDGAGSSSTTANNNNNKNNNAARAAGYKKQYQQTSDPKAANSYYYTNSDTTATQQQQQQQQHPPSHHDYINAASTIDDHADSAYYQSLDAPMPDTMYEEHYGDAYVGAPIKYVYPSGYQSMRPRGGPWKLSIAICILFTWLSIFIVGHCSDRNGANEMDDDAMVIETKWCGSRLLYFMWVMSMLITGLSAAYCSVIGYIKVRDFAVANQRSQPPGMVGKSDYYVTVDDVASGSNNGKPSSDGGYYQKTIYQSDGTPQFWGGHIYRPTQAAVAVTSR